MVSGSFVWSDTGGAVAEFFKVFLGGGLTGIVIGIVLSEFLVRMKVGVSSYLVLSIVLAYASFAVAEHLLHVSGVMAVVAGAITLGILGASRIPQSSTHIVKETWEMIALVCNSLLFLLVGISMNLLQLMTRIDAICIAILLVLVARAATVYSMVPATIWLFKLPHVSLGERHIMWWGGLKGGLAIAIVMSMPTDIPGKTLLLDLTLGVAMFSLLINASTIRPLIKMLGMDRLTDDEREEFRHGLQQAEENANGILDKFHQTGLISRGTQKLIQTKNRELFASDLPEQDNKKEIRHLNISALRLEIDKLKYLYDIGMIQYYIYLDIKNNIQRDRENWTKDTQIFRYKIIKANKIILSGLRMHC